MRNYRDAPEAYQYEHPGKSASAWKILQPLVGRALTNRKYKLDTELLSLRDSISSDLYRRIDGIVREKMDFMQKLVQKLGKGEAESILTDDERVSYTQLNGKALEIWKDVENELNIIELERLLTAKIGTDLDKIRKINIAIVGSIKSGKSQFIYDVTGEHKSNVASESNLHPYTKRFHTATCIIQGTDIHSRQNYYYVTLIDTPGFDYADRSNDEKVGFTSLLTWVRTSFPGRRLDGIIYLHSIQLDELDERRSLFHYSQPLRDLWPNDWDRRIVFVNTFYSEDSLGPQNQRMSSEDMTNRQEAVRQGYLSLTKSDIPMMRYDAKSGESAKGILGEALQYISTL